MKQKIKNDKYLCMWGYSNLSEPDRQCCMGIGFTPINHLDNTCKFEGINPKKNCPIYIKTMKEAEENKDRLNMQRDAEYLDSFT